MQGLYKILAEAALLLHAAFIVFVVLGGLSALRNAKWAWLHIPAAIWGSLVECMGWICPLTHLENWLRYRAGVDAYQDSFIAHFMQPIVYPAGLTPQIQVMLGTGVVIINLMIYSLVLSRRAKRRQ